ncbi:MAG: sensor histidine kinase [Parashewanella sp.]
MSFNPALKQTARLVLFSFSLLSLVYLWSQQGISAIVIVLLLVNTVLGCALINPLQKQQTQLRNLLNAIVNGDPTLGLPASHPLRQQMVQVNNSLKYSRQQAEQQSHYLQTLMVHLEQAILVVDEAGNIIQKNPASERLLGQLPENVSQLQQLGDCITQTRQQQKFTIPWKKGEHNDTLSVQVNCVNINNQSLKLVSIQSIHLALQAKEQHAYKKLTKVLTHEIANSITPLASLAQTANTLLPKTLTFEDEEDKQDLQLALQTINNRTQHLDEFIARFRSLSQLPAPKLEICSLKILVEQVVHLFQAQLAAYKIDLRLSLNHDYQLMADASQIEQVLINLLKNAIEAVDKQKDKWIAIELTQNAQAQVMLDISDSGEGIEPHVQEVIFVPFFTTKPTGSGIGLSLSRQIMIQHGGDLTYISKPETNACFRLLFS